MTIVIYTAGIEITEETSTPPITNPRKKAYDAFVDLDTFLVFLLLLVTSW